LTSILSFEGRLSLLRQPHMQSLTSFRKHLLKGLPAGAFVPNFDPMDAGIEARVLLLLETPGRVPRKTCFTSLDNPSATSKNPKALVGEADLKRSALLLWNLVPWTSVSKQRCRPAQAPITPWEHRPF
jgi:uracil-DNA glycosylase